MSGASDSSRCDEGFAVPRCDEGNPLAADRVDDALNFADRALELARERGQRGYEAWTLRLLGEIAARPGSSNGEVAEGHYRLAALLADQLGMRPLLARCHLDLGALWARLGKRRDAEDHLTTAMVMCREMNMVVWVEHAEAEARRLA